MQQCADFIDALKNYEIVQESDIAKLSGFRANNLEQIELLGKYKDSCENPLKEAVKVFSVKIAALEKELADNKALVGLILIEIKATFAKSLAKFVCAPEVHIAQQQHLQPVLQFKTREV